MAVEAVPLLTCKMNMKNAESLLEIYHNNIESQNYEDAAFALGKALHFLQDLGLLLLTVRENGVITWFQRL
ncbi:MAG: hypothetical protein R2941_02100 [Desulfobacterales bacterium]